MDTDGGSQCPELDNAVTSAMIKAISENSKKRARCLHSQGEGVFLMTIHSEIWGETEKPGRIMDTQAFIGDDYTDLLKTLRCREVDLVGYLKRILKIASLKMDLGVHVFLKNYPKI